MDGNSSIVDCKITLLIDFWSANTSTGVPIGLCIEGCLGRRPECTALVMINGMPFAVDLFIKFSCFLSNERNC